MAPKCCCAITDGPRHKVDGRWSWVVLFCATLCHTISVGIMKTAGVFFPVIIERLDSSRERVAWIGSGANGLFLFAGPLAAALTNRFGCRSVTIVGGLLCSVGLLCTSLATKTFHYYLAYSLLFGLGGCFVRTSCFLVMAKYFWRRRALGTGLLSSAGGLGLFALGPINQQLINSMGMDNSYKVLAGLCLVIIAAAWAFHPNVEAEEGHLEHNIEQEIVEPRKAKFTIDCSVWKVPAYVVMVITFAIGIMGITVPPQHLVKHAKEVGFSSDRASNLFAFIGITSCFSRIAGGWLCDIKWINPRYVYQLGTFLNGVIICLFAIGRSYPVFVILSLLFGVAEGISTTVSNLIILNIVGPRRRPSAMGLANAVMAVFIAGGSPIIGLMADKLGSYESAFYTLGSVIVFASFLPFILLCLPPTKAKAVLGPERVDITHQGSNASENFGMKEYCFVTSV